MVEINLFPWRMHVYAKKRKQIILLCWVLFVFLFSIIIVCNLLGREIYKHQAKIIDLKKQIQSNQSIRPVIKEHVFQYHLEDVLRQINDASSFAIQLNKVSVGRNHTYIVGQIGSVSDLSQWVKHASKMYYVKIIEIKSIPFSNLSQFQMILRRKV